MKYMKKKSLKNIMIVLVLFISLITSTNIYAQSTEQKTQPQSQPPLVTNEQIRVANQIFIEHKYQKEMIGLLEEEVSLLDEQVSVLYKKVDNTEKKYEISQTMYKQTKKENTLLKIGGVALIILSVVLGVSK